jgi:hypothetical protein
MKTILNLYEEATDRTHDSMAAAILVLACVIQNKNVINQESAENFGNKLALALKHAISFNASNHPGPE